MLVLERKRDQTIRIYDRRTGETGVSIKVVSCSGGKVKIGIDAERSLVIVRDELERRAA